MPERRQRVLRVVMSLSKLSGWNTTSSSSDAAQKLNEVRFSNHSWNFKRVEWNKLSLELEINSARSAVP